MSGAAIGVQLTDRQRKRALWGLGLAVAVDSIGAGVVLPVFTAVFLDSDTLTDSTSVETRQFLLAIAIAAYPLGMLIGAPVLGYFSDRYGRRKLILMAIAGGAVMSAISGLAIAVGSVMLLFGSRFVAGLFAGNMALARAASADLSGPDKRFVYMSIIGMAANGGFVISPILGGVAASVDPAVPFYAVGVLCLLTVIAVAWLLPETERVEGEEHPPSGVRAVWTLLGQAGVRNSLLAYLSVVIGWNIFFQFASVLLLQRFDATTVALGVFTALVGVYGVIASSAVARWLNRRTTLNRITIGALVTMIPSAVIFGFAGNQVVAWLVVIPLSAGCVLATSGIPTRASELVDDRSQGTVAGALSAMTAIGWAAGPLIAALGAVVGLSFTFVLAAVGCGIAIYFFARTRSFATATSASL